MARILIVEDDPAILSQIATPLRRANHEVLTAVDGSEALQALGVGVKFAPQRPDVVLLDVMLPNVNGFMVCSKMQEDANASSVPVIMVSGFDDFKEPFRKFKNIAGWIDKPFEMPELLNKVADVLMDLRQKDAK